MIPDVYTLTPVEQRGDVLVKREDHFVFAGITGSKVRACLVAADGAKGLVAASSRVSQQVARVARVAHALSIPARIHIPFGPTTVQMEDALNNNAELIRVKPGYNNCIIASARRDAQRLGWTEIPFGVEGFKTCELVAHQVQNIPTSINRIVVTVGSGITISGILTGLRERQLDIPVLGIAVGALPFRRIHAYAPFMWWKQTTIIHSELPYQMYGKYLTWRGIKLDPIYESKVAEYLQPNDLFWVIGTQQIFE